MHINLASLFREVTHRNRTCGQAQVRECLFGLLLHGLIGRLVPGSAHWGAALYSYIPRIENAFKDAQLPHLAEDMRSVAAAVLGVNLAESNAFSRLSKALRTLHEQSFFEPPQWRTGAVPTPLDNLLIEWSLQPTRTSEQWAEILMVLLVYQDYPGFITSLYPTCVEAESVNAGTAEPKGEPVLVGR